MRRMIADFSVVYIESIGASGLSNRYRYTRGRLLCPWDPQYTSIQYTCTGVPNCEMNR